MQANLNERIFWIDVAKGLGIFLVVLYHIPSISSFNFANIIGKWVTTFYMPLFFIMSGFFASTKVRKVSRRLLFPYLFFYILALALFVIKSIIKGETLDYNYLIAPFLGKTNNYENTPIWFLLCLFEINCIYYCVKRISNKVVYIIVSLIIGYWGYLMGEFNVIKAYYLSVALLCFPFFSIANVAKKSLIAEKPFYYYFVSLLMSTLVCFYFGHENNISQNFIQDQYGVFVFVSFTASYGLFGLAQYLSRIRLLEKSVSYWGRNSIIVLCTHMLLMSIPTILYEYFGKSSSTLMISLFIIVVFESLIIFVFNKSSLLMKVIGK